MFTRDGTSQASQLTNIARIIQVPYDRVLSTQFSTAYDVYLSILHQVDERADLSLGHTGLRWRMRNICPPCLYKLEAEPPLKYSILCTMDGNSSLKHVANDYRSGSVRKDEC